MNMDIHHNMDMATDQSMNMSLNCNKKMATDHYMNMGITLKCLSIGTPKNNKFSICPKWKIHCFQVSQNLGRVQPHYNVLEYLDP